MRRRRHRLRPRLGQTGIVSHPSVRKARAIAAARAFPCRKRLTGGAAFAAAIRTGASPPRSVATKPLVLATNSSSVVWHGWCDYRAEEPARSAGAIIHGDRKMLYYAVVFFIIALIAALFGFGGIAAGAAGIAKILFVIFLVVAVVTFLLSLARR
jgi:uncharacterized membrane protein YtjA (UPF0391 family)